jgi:DNA polymerase-3 subunit delta'
VATLLEGYDRRVAVELDRHPHARAVLAPALASPAHPSHAYLFHGPGGSGKRAVARELAAALLSEGAPDPGNASARAVGGVHPDLTWVTPSGAHEILVSDIDRPVILAASRTPFESSRRVFVIERADELGDEAANRMLKTLEEPPPFVHLILLTDRLGEVLPTIRSRCQAVRFEAPDESDAAAALVAAGIDEPLALACVRLALQDSERARELASEDGRALREAAQRYAQAAVTSEMATRRPWVELLRAARARGELAGVGLQERERAELELTSRKERRRVENEWNDRIRRVKRRVQTGALDLGLQLVSLWFSDLAALAWGADSLVRNVDRLGDLREHPGVAPAQAFAAIELVEETRRRFELNVSEELACEALAYRLEEVLAR